MDKPDYLPDLTRCECEYLDGSFMTLGPRQRVRCDAAPTVVAIERNASAKDNKRGSMSLCDEHNDTLARQRHDVTIVPIADWPSDWAKEVSRG